MVLDETWQTDVQMDRLTKAQLWYKINLPFFFRKKKVGLIKAQQYS